MRKKRTIKTEKKERLQGEENNNSVNSCFIDPSLNGEVFLYIFKKTNSLLLDIKHTKSVQISSISFRETIKQFVKDYFRLLRPELSAQGIQTVNLDKLMQVLMKMANFYTSTKIYKKIIEEIHRQLENIEVEREFIASNLLAQSRSDRIEGITVQDKNILRTLELIVPVAAISYKQAVEDLQGKRFSYRGTATELRETLREVLDHLAPDQEVISASGFKFEEGKKKPTMKQKVRFILKNRGKNATAIGTPEEATLIVDEGIAKLVRATYERGCLSTHTQGEGRSEALQIKIYLDSVLCELLEIR